MTTSDSDREKLLAAIAAEEAAEAALMKRYNLLTSILCISVFTGFIGLGVWVYHAPRPVPMEFAAIMVMLCSILHVGQTLIGIWYKHSSTENPDLRAILKEAIPSLCFGASTLIMPFTFFSGWMWIFVGITFLVGIVISRKRRRAQEQARAARRAARGRSTNNPPS